MGNNANYVKLVETCFCKSLFTNVLVIEKIQSNLETFGVARCLIRLRFFVESIFSNIGRDT